MLSIPSKTLGEFKKDYGKDWVVGYVSMWLIDLNDSAQVKTRMNDSQMEFTAERIYETYSLRITDLTLFFRNVKEGSYGPYYENLSGEKIMEWLKQYYDLRCEYAQMHSQSNRTDWFKENTSQMTKEEIKEGLEIMFKGVGEAKAEAQKGDGAGTRYKNLVYANHAFRKKIMFEHELPKLTDEEYAKWYESSFLLDGERVGKPISSP